VPEHAADASFLRRSAPPRQELAAHSGRRATAWAGRPLGRYWLSRPIPSGPPDRCYHGLALGVAGFEKPLFIRVFARALLDDFELEPFRRVALAAREGIEVLYDLGEAEDEGRACGYLVSQLLEGASLAELDAALAARGERLSLALGLAIFAEARAQLAALHEAGLVHGRLEPGKVRVGPGWRSAVSLCHGLRLAPRAGTPTDDVLALGRAVLPLAAGRDRERVAGLLTGPDPRGFAIVADLIAEREPRLSEAAVELLWPEGGLPAPAAADRVLAACVTPAELRALWRLVAELGDLT